MKTFVVILRYCWILPSFYLGMKGNNNKIILLQASQLYIDNFLQIIVK